jgi:23S rRNA pseudouridine2605 synthase
MVDRRPRPRSSEPRGGSGSGRAAVVHEEREDGIRLQKVLASAGVGSRRHCEELIAKRRVSVNGAIVREQGLRVDPETDVLEVDGVRVVTQAGLVYLAANKPRGMISSMSDEKGRESLGDMVAERTERLFHVGRLDADSEGLILMSNDGELAHRLMHPSFEVDKTYLIEVPGPVGKEVMRKLRKGLVLEDGPAKADEVRVLEAAGNRVLLEMTLHEGRKHIVRRMMDEVGHPVRQLVRTRIGPVHIGTLRANRVRHLTRFEVGALYKLVGL